MIDIVDRLEFDATRVKVNYSGGVGSNIDDAVKTIRCLREVIRATAPEIEVRKRLSFAEAEAIYAADKRG